MDKEDVNKIVKELIEIKPPKFGTVLIRFFQNKPAFLLKSIEIDKPEKIVL